VADDHLYERTDGQAFPWGMPDPIERDPGMTLLEHFASTAPITFADAERMLQRRFSARMASITVHDIIKHLVWLRLEYAFEMMRARRARLDNRLTEEERKEWGKRHPP
jgi:hypothetical protein